MSKYIFVTGGVISGTGKGIASASLGLLLRLRGHKINIIKFDPYLNVNAGILAPREHGECFVCDDGTECDLDLGSYERISGINVSKRNICTSGNLYKELIEEQEKGKFLGQTVQIVPHVTNKIQNILLELGKDSDVVIAEIGGTVGDIESACFYESIRNFKRNNDCAIIMVAPILWVPTIKEFKTKPLQNSIKELQRHGLSPDILLCRVDREVPNKILEKVSSITNVPRECVFDAPDVSTIYQVPIEFYNRHIDDIVVDVLNLKRSPCRIYKYKEKLENYENDKDKDTINIGIFGKYDNCDEAYVSIKEALWHSGLNLKVKINIKWINSEEINKDNVKEMFKDIHGMIIPGGFDSRGVDGKIESIKYARENNIPFLGICLGLQCAVIEFCRNVCGIEKADSMEFNKNTEEPVIHYVEGQKELKIKSSTMRLGSYDCELKEDSKVYELYGEKNISERHRHRLEVNSKYLEILEKNNFICSGKNPETNLIEIMELKDHIFFIGVQSHPEFKSNLISPSPLFLGLIKNSILKKNG